MKTLVRSLIVAFALATVLTVIAPVHTQAISLKEEIELGQKIDVEVLKETPLITDRKALAEIDEYGQKLVANVNRPEIKYHFRIIQDNDFNAFATPGGYVYFTHRLWKVMRRDERIGVLAHEIVHVDQRHSLDAISKQRTRQIWLAVLLTAVNANSTVTQIADIAHSVYSLKYSRADEREADKFGVQLADKAGYNPVGLLLALRKIGRFQSEQGAEPPKVFSSHPPTKERLDYITSLLTDLKLDIPPDNPAHEDSPYRIGTLSAVSGDEVRFSASKALQKGHVVWAMNDGWDYYYEKRVPAPAARVVVKAGDQKEYVGGIQVVPRAKSSSIAKGLGVYDPPRPDPEKATAWIEYSANGDNARIVADKAPGFLRRYLARQVVWNNDYTKLVYDNTGYLVVTDASGPVNYVYLSNPAFAYVPINQGANLTVVNDESAARWIGPIVSIGRRGATIEVRTARSKDQLASYIGTDKRFDAVVPPWDSNASYDDRIAAKAAMKSVDGKMVLQIVTFSPGWSMNRITNGLDVYEAAPAKKE